MILKQIAAPAVEPVSLAEAKLHLRVDIADDDTLITALISAAREYFEGATGRALITQKWRLSLETWPGNVVELPRAPLVSVDDFEYIDSAGTTTDVGAAVYDVDTDSEPGRIVLAYGQTWPSTTLAIMNPIQIEYTAGYGAAATAVPEHMRQAIKLLVAHWYENREPVSAGEVAREVPFALKSLIYLYRIY
jgi:uncharacterized phiE125 gp8 family phage protein